MDYKKSKAPVNTVTRNLRDLWEPTGNIYESVAIIAKRANQISVEIKQDLSKKQRADRDLTFLRETPEAYTARHPGVSGRQHLLA